MSAPRRIAALIDDLRLTASGLQQVIDACQVYGPGAELIQHYPKMLSRLADQWQSEADRVPWSDDLARIEIITPEEMEALDEAEALLNRLRGDASG